ncbi:MAG TPA: creatininase family protein [Bacteroidales bacterium]|nr:creatininase family protein [Bacteroidales bacterium]
MKKLLLNVALIIIMTIDFASGQVQQPLPDKLPVKLEELTSADFVRAVKKSGGVCIIPLGVFEKHGQHLPLGTDLIVVRELALRAAKKEYAVVFPEYYFGQINEAKHQPGTIAYSPELLWMMLQETLNELYRNGFKKIILVNGHGGNSGFLNYFLISQLNSPKDYSVILFSPVADTEFRTKQEAYFQSFAPGGHAGELETSLVLATRPDLVFLDRARLESGEDLDRLGSLKNQTSGFWWYASFPNHYHGDGSYGNVDLGELTLEHQSDLLARLIKEFKNSNVLEELQKEFFNKIQNPR